KIRAGLGEPFVLGFVGEYFEEALLLLRIAVQKLTSEFRLASCVDPVEPGKESRLRVFAETNRILRGSYFGSRADRNAICQHKVDEFGHASFPGARCVVRGNNHFGQMLDQAKVLGREKKSLVWLRCSLGGR